MHHRQRIETEIAEFHRFLSPKFPPLKIEHAFDVYDLEKEWKSGVQAGRWRLSGVYLVFDDDGGLLKVGKATATFNKRIKKQAGMERASTFEIIAFPEGYVCFAHALEAFLIAKLRPAGNKCGANEYIPCLPPDW